ARDVEHPKPATAVGQLCPQIVGIGIVEPAEIDLGPLQSIVPPDGVRIPLDQLEKTLNDGFFQRIAGSTAIGIRLGGVFTPAVEEVHQAGWKVSESLIAKRPGR